MLKYPKELLSKSINELKRELEFTHIGERKWVYYSDSICRVNRGPAGKFILQFPDKTHTLISFNEFSEYANSITFDEIKKIKLDAVRNISSRWTIERFVSWLDKIASQHVDSDHYEITQSSSEIFLVIHYPELTITNSIELSHTMRDIYLKYHFNHEPNYGFNLNRISLARTTFEDRELPMSYVFSHHNSGSLGEYGSSFCYGSTDMGTFVQRNTGSYIHPINFLDRLLILFKDYLQWESIEGVPYKYIDSLGNSGSNYTNKFLGLSDARIFKDKYILLINSLSNIKYSYSLSTYYSIKLDSDTVNEIDDILTSIIDDDKLKAIRIDGRSVLKQRSLYEQYGKRYNGRETSVIFKGEQKKIKIIDTSTNQENEPQMKIHIALLDAVVREIESRIEKILINEKM